MTLEIWKLVKPLDYDITVIVTYTVCVGHSDIDRKHSVKVTKFSMMMLYISCFYSVSRSGV